MILYFAPIVIRGMNMTNTHDKFFKSLPDVVASTDHKGNHVDLFRKLNPVDPKTGRKLKEDVKPDTTDPLGFRQPYQGIIRNLINNIDICTDRYFLEGDPGYMVARKKYIKELEELKTFIKKKEVELGYYEVDPDSTVLFDLHNIERKDSDDIDAGQE